MLIDRVIANLPYSKGHVDWWGGWRGAHFVFWQLVHNTILRIVFLKTQDQIIVFLILYWNVAHLKTSNVLIDMLQDLILYVKQLFL